MIQNPSNYRDDPKYAQQLLREIHDQHHRTYFALLKPDKLGVQHGYTAGVCEMDRSANLSGWCSKGFSILSEHYSLDAARQAIRTYQRKH